MDPKDAAPLGRRPMHLQLSAEFFDLLLRLFLGDAVAFLDLSRKVFAITFGDFEVVFGQLAPFRFELAGKLLPLTFDLVFVNWKILSCRG